MGTIIVLHESSYLIFMTAFKNLYAYYEHNTDEETES